VTVKVAELAAGWVDLETGFQPKWRTKHYSSITVIAIDKKSNYELLTRPLIGCEQIIQE